MIWKTITDPDQKRLFIEVRDNALKRVAFSAFDFKINTWIMKDVIFEEPWWISLAGVSGNTLLLTLYTDTNNPDKKSIFAFDIEKQKNIWWKNNFAITMVTGDKITGTETKFGSKELILDIKDGNELKNGIVLEEEQNFMIIRPFQYHEGNEHFETVSGFLKVKCQIYAAITIEYCEYNSLILISCFTGKDDLANFLIVFEADGNLLLKETLGEHLKGIALDTFFIFEGYLIFVKNKCELVSYKIV